MDQYKKMVVMHPPEEKAIIDIRSHLEKFLGGSVDLVKNEENGLATVLINHEAKRNAISGRFKRYLKKNGLLLLSYFAF